MDGFNGIAAFILVEGHLMMNVKLVDIMLCRFKGPLMRAIRDAGAKYDDYSISPGRRQTLLHWGYELTETDYKDWLKNNKK